MPCRLPETGLHERMALGFALVRALEDQGDFDGALRALHKANAMRCRQLNWNPQNGPRATRPPARKLRSATPGAPILQQGDEVIFLVGLPCSGTGLLAKILSSHPRVAINHEAPDLEQVLDDESRRRGQSFAQWAPLATPEDWSRLGQDYLARTARWRVHKPRFIDCHAHNWRLAGAAMAMLPGARMINARRNPLETCLACYRQLFAEGEDYSFNLDHMVSHWRDYDRISEHWRNQFPERFVDHAFEAWLDDPDAAIQRLSGWLRAGSRSGLHGAVARTARGTHHHRRAAGGSVRAGNHAIGALWRAAGPAAGLAGGRGQRRALSRRRQLDQRRCERASLSRRCRADS